MQYHTAACTIIVLFSLSHFYLLVPLCEARATVARHQQCSQACEQQVQESTDLRFGSSWIPGDQYDLRAQLRSLPHDAQQRLSNAKVLYLQAIDGDRRAGEQAGNILMQLAEEYPDDAMIRVYLGSVRLLEARDAWLMWRKYQLSIEGLAFLDAAVAQAPENVEIRFIRAVSTYHLPDRARRSEQSATDLQWVVGHARNAVSQGQLDPHLAAAAFYYHGLCRAAQSDVIGARVAWEMTQVLAPSSSSAQKAAVRLQTVR